MDMLFLFLQNQCTSIIDGLYLGNYKAAYELAPLLSLGITHILTIGEELKLFHPDHFQYKYVQLQDLVNSNIIKHFEECHTFIK